MIVKVTGKTLSGSLIFDYQKIKTVFGKIDSLAAMELTGLIYTIKNETGIFLDLINILTYD